ncbi:hypothetical protein [Bacillus sp. UNC438CL73TsuS30]|nr:hypothetical protein [Bacillus sp. UNC438CL73TsuS30]
MSKKGLEQLKLPGIKTYKLVVPRKDVKNPCASFQLELDLYIEDKQ